MFDIFSNLEKKPARDEIVTLSVRMPKQLREDFTALCAKHGVDASEVIRALIKSQIDLDIIKG